VCATQFFAESVTGYNLSQAKASADGSLYTWTPLFVLAYMFGTLSSFLYFRTVYLSPPSFLCHLFSHYKVGEGTARGQFRAAEILAEVELEKERKKEREAKRETIRKREQAFLAAIAGPQ